MKNEIISDLDDWLYNFYKVAQAEPVRLLKRLKRTICFEQEFKRASRVVRGKEEARDDIDKAVCLWMNLSWAFNLSAGGCSLRVHLDPTRESISGLKQKRMAHYPLLLKRLKKTVILNRNVLKMLEQFDSSESFFYIDPPYVDTSQSYACKFTREDWDKMIDKLKSLKGLFMLSHYSDESMTFPTEWVIKKLRTKCAINHKASGKERDREECIIMNYENKNDQLGFIK